MQLYYDREWNPGVEWLHQVVFIPDMSIESVIEAQVQYKRVHPKSMAAKMIDSYIKVAACEEDDEAWERESVCSEVEVHEDIGCEDVHDPASTKALALKEAADSVEAAKYIASVANNRSTRTVQVAPGSEEFKLLESLEPGKKTTRGLNLETAIKLMSAMVKKAVKTVKDEAERKKLKKVERLGD